MKNIMMCDCSGRWGSVAPLVLRLATGAIFLVHGLMKLMTMGLPGTTGFLASLGFPAPGLFAVLLIAAEVIGGAFLVLGLFTHWSAKVLAVVALVALFTVHLKNGFLISAGGYEFIMLIFAACVSLMITGAGKWSLDQKLFKKA
ncbi:MAG TPA: DoxX family protein [Candidatus Paceibacterota bacterium]|nr:DoxX family protein [Candidatus Paceibacterota bacterium]